MAILEVSHLRKTFGVVKAVDDLSFQVEKGEIFGLLGPNGAGKTTTIRLVLDLFKPDSGQISILGGEMSEEKKERIGYMPEERGLYQDIPLERCLLYLANLKGVTMDEARKRLSEYLERFDLAAYRQKKVKELSKGMQQKAQIIATLMHEPELIIVDEPFAALDPVNTRMIIGLLEDLHQSGVTIIMSTHQMHQVEELCDRILLIDRGRALLYGELEAIRRSYTGQAVRVRTAGELPRLPGVQSVEASNGAYQLALVPGTDPQAVLRALLEQDAVVEHFEIALPGLDEIFIRAVQGEGSPQ
jgi:ABC-2 type transport system ATP-binding protein